MAFELDEAGGAEVLKVLAMPLVREVTRQVEGGAGPDADSRVIVTDRAHGQVRVPAYRQARDGALTRAAAAAGLEVNPE